MEIKSITITQQAFDDATASVAQKFMEMGKEVDRSFAAIMVSARNSIYASELWHEMSDSHKADDNTPDVVIVDEKEFGECVMKVFNKNVEEMTGKVGTMRAICFVSAFFTFADSIWGVVSGREKKNPTGQGGEE